MDKKALLEKLNKIILCELCGISVPRRTTESSLTIKHTHTRIRLELLDLDTNIYQYPHHSADGARVNHITACGSCFINLFVHLNEQAQKFIDHRKERLKRSEHFQEVVR